VIWDFNQFQNMVRHKSGAERILMYVEIFN
jgi:hypothetical protein